MKLPSDAQAALLALIAEREAAGEAVEWNTTPGDDYRPSRARLYVEHIDRERDEARLESADEHRDVHRVATVRACLRAGWLNGLHSRTVAHLPAYFIGARPQPWSLTQLDTTEDGVIALGLWRERKLNATPAPLPTLSGRELEIAELAMRAYELGYALSPRKDARLEARRMRKAGWFTRCWLANSAYGLVPSPLALVEVRPELADVPA